MLLLDILLFVASCALLVVSTRVLLNSLVKIASYLELKEFVVGFMLMAVATSLPELFVGIIAALEHTSLLSLGNVIGANIMDLTIVIGTVALLTRGIKARSEIAKKDALYMLLIALFPILLMLDHVLSRIDGFILLLAFSIYMIRLFGQRKEFRKTTDHVSKKSARKSFIWFAFGVIGLLISAKFVVMFATAIATEMAVPLLLIGLVIVAIGTTLPELAFETKAAMSGHEEMTLGDLFGSLVTNSTLVLGIVAIINPIEIVNFSLFLVAAGFMFLTLLLFTLFIRSDEGISWQGGVALILLYVIFIIIELVLEVGIIAGG